MHNFSNAFKVGIAIDSQLTLTLTDAKKKKNKKKKKKNVKIAIDSQLSLAKKRYNGYLQSEWLLIVLKYGNYISIKLYSYLSR